MNPDLVHPKDFASALALHDCCHSCLNRARMELTNDNLEEAERWVKEFQRCKRDLDKLIAKKKFYDNLNALAKDLQENGINAEVIKKAHC